MQRIFFFDGYFSSFVTGCFFLIKIISHVCGLFCAFNGNRYLQLEIHQCFWTFQYLRLFFCVGHKRIGTNGLITIVFTHLVVIIFTFVFMCDDWIKNKKNNRWSSRIRTVIQGECEIIFFHSGCRKLLNFFMLLPFDRFVRI